MYLGLVCWLDSVNLLLINIALHVPVKGRKGQGRQRGGQKGGVERAPLHKAVLGTVDMDRDETSSTTTESSLENEKVRAGFLTYHNAVLLQSALVSTIS
jgi:hypothetical protein